MNRQYHVVVVGGGAFGGWTALRLLRGGAAVTLVDLWGAGNVRSSSSGSTRVLRLAYPRKEFLEIARKAKQHWLEFEQETGRHLFEETGLLWLTSQFGALETTILANYDEAGVPYRRLDSHDLRTEYPEIRTDDLEGAFFEPGAGFLHALEATRLVAAQVEIEGGTVQEARARLGPIDQGKLKGLELGDGGKLEADAFVIAAGPWLPQLFPELLGTRLHVSRQETFTFGIGSSESQFYPTKMPVWAYRGERFWYGIPGNGSVGGFKLADDTRGPSFEPTTGNRLPSSGGISLARDFLNDRFPSLTGAPLIEGKVCQYTGTPDGRFLGDRHPEAENLWLVGGGSGHGFKHGPIVGDYLRGLVLGEVEPGDNPAFCTIGDLIDIP